MALKILLGEIVALLELKDMLLAETEVNESSVSNQGRKLVLPTIITKLGISDGRLIYVT